MDSLIAREGNSLPNRLRMWAHPQNWPGLHSIEGDVARYDMRTAADTIERLEKALEPFAAFAEKAEAFVAARAKDGGSPILPSTDFRLSDFKRAAAALASDDQQESRSISGKNTSK